MEDSFDSYNAPKYIDFEMIGNGDDNEDVDKFFDVEYELHPVPAHSESIPVVAEVSPLYKAAAEQVVIKTPASSKKRRSKSASSVENHSENSSRDVSTYLTPGTSKRKSQVAYLNGRSLLVQNYDGISIVTPNKTHNMDTRLDMVIKSPGLALRTRSVSRDANGEQEVAGNALKRSVRKSRRLLHEMEQAASLAEELPETQHARKEVHEIQPAPPELDAVKNASTVIEQPTEKPMSKRTRLQYQAPLMATHPASKLVPMRPHEDAQSNKSVKFMAAAELVHHFHRDTPERFHSRPANGSLQNKLHIRKPSASQMLPRNNTIPKSPFLTTKQRQLCKPQHHIPSQRDREEEELEEMKKNQVKANPLKPSVLVPLPVIRPVLAKTPTRFEPFNLSRGKRKEPTPEPVFKFKAQAIPRGMLNSPKGVPPKKELPLTEPQSPALKINAKYPKRVRVETPDNKEKDVAHFGVTNKLRVTPVRNTKPQPFSFEKRDRDRELRKQEMMQKQLEDERQAREFKALRKPKFGAVPLLPEKKNVALTKPQTPQLSAFTLGAQMQQKFKEKIEEENAKRQKAALFHARPATVTQKKPYQPHLPHRKLEDITGMQLNTEKRAAERAVFDEMLKMKEMEEAKLRAQLQARLEEEAHQEELRIRKEAEFHAKPLVIPSPPKIEPSSKPLTEPMSPNFQAGKRANRSRNLAM